MTADGLVSIPLHLLGGILGVNLPLTNKEVFCSVREGLWGGISAPLCAKAKKKKVRATRQFEEEVWKNG